MPHSITPQFRAILHWKRLDETKTHTQLHCTDINHWDEAIGIAFRWKFTQ